ncbi:uncharacterized protein [Antedon mediterranea]|uniref:uncharacterized protein n=1 Tax=Antedon mediterranea TaxID=105859 RepID=UPI003AF451CF
MSLSDTEVEVNHQNSNGSPGKKKKKSKISLIIPNFFRSKSQQDDSVDEGGLSDDEKCGKIEDDEPSEMDVDVKEESTSNRITIPGSNSGACSAPILHEPVWPMTPPESVHPCLRIGHRRRSTTISEGENLEEKVCMSRCRHVTFSPDTIDPPPRSSSYCKYLESKSSCPIRNLKHEKHKQKMFQLKKVNLSDFLSTSHQRSPLTFTMSCDMMF